MERIPPPPAGPMPAPGPQQQRPLGGNMGQMPMHQQQQQQWPNQFPTSYEEFTLRKAEPEPGSKPSWSRVKIIPSSISATEFAKENKIGRASVDVNTAYDSLRTDHMRDAIDRLLEDLRSQEPNPFAMWKLAYIKAVRRPINGTFGNATETTHIRVIFKRVPKQNMSNSPITKFTRVIDTTEQQQVWPNQIMNQQLPPPPPGMLPIQDQRLPPPPMNLPQGMNLPQNMKPGGVGGPGISIIDPKVGKFNDKGNKDKKKDGKKSRDSSPEPTRKSEKTIKEKVMEWKSPDLRKKSHSRYDDDDDVSDKAVYEETIKHKVSGPRLSRDFRIPQPPMGDSFMSGANRRQRPRAPPSPILRRRSSIKEIRGSDRRGSRLIEETTRVYRSDDSSDGWDRLSDRVWDEDDRDELSSKASSYDSRISPGDHKYRRGSKSHLRRPRSRSHRRSQSRDRLYRDERRASFSSSDRDAYPPRAFREHRKPSAFRGSSPISSNGSTTSSGRKKEVHVHHHYTDPTTVQGALTKPQYPRHSVSLPIRGPPSPILRPQPRQLMYGEQPTYDAYFPPGPIVQAPMATDYTNPISQREMAAEAHMAAERRRAAIHARELEDLKWEAEKTKRDIERLNRDRPSREIRYGSPVDSRYSETRYGDSRYGGTRQYSDDRAPRVRTEFHSTRSRYP